MNARSFLLAIACALAPSFALADAAVDSIVAQLRTQGFTEITVTETLLGRIRIYALRTDLERELVYNPSTGEILRDYWQARGDGEHVAPILRSPDDPAGAPATVSDDDESSDPVSGSEAENDDDETDPDQESGSNSGPGSDDEDADSSDNRDDEVSPDSDDDDSDTPEPEDD